MSNLQHTLSIILAMGLGSTLTLLLHQNASADAMHGVSYGQNPVVSIGGTAYDGETKNLLTAPTGQALIITDIILSSTSNGYCIRSHKTDLLSSTGAVLGQFETSSSSMAYNQSGAAIGGSQIQSSLVSGLRIPAGEQLQLVVVQSSTAGNSYCGSPTSYGVRYMISGYYAHP